MKTLEKGQWNPYVAGALAGLVSIFSVWGAGKFLGASTSFVKSAAMVEKLFVPEHVATLDYFVKNGPKIDWQWMFVVGILLGALVASLSAGTFRMQAVPDMWKSRFGGAIGTRAAIAFIGGAVAMFGARLADG